MIDSVPPTQSAIAQALGVAKSRITALKSQGMPTHSIEAAHAWREENLSPARIKSTAHAAPAIDDGEKESYAEARRRRETSEADKSAIELATLKGELINRAALEMATETAFRHIRDTILSVPDRLPIDSTHRAMFRNALRDTLSDALKMLPSTMASESRGASVAVE